MSKIACRVRLANFGFMNMQVAVFLPKSAKYISMALTPWNTLWQLYLAPIHNLRVEGFSPPSNATFLLEKIYLTLVTSAFSLATHCYRSNSLCV